MATMRSELPFDLMSYARRGPGRRDRLSPAEIQQIARTANRTPEVMIKVLPRGTNSLASVQKHLGYIGRKGELDLETDNGDSLQGKGVGQELLSDWDLDLDSYRGKSDLVAGNGRPAPKLVHKVMFSMPAGTPPDKVLEAVKNFCREEFALKHRYAMALHTDEPHPHVHVVIKAVSEQGQRLHIRKATIREWRSEFARHLRALGVAANATQRSVRGDTSPRKPDGIYRASLRGDSTHMRERAAAVARELAQGGLRIESGKATLVDTRKDVRLAWLGVSNMLGHDGHRELAVHVRRFVDQMPQPLTDKEQLAAALLKTVREPRVRDESVVR
jgi:hypothetical protein